MSEKEDYYILSKGSVLQGYKYVFDVSLKEDGSLKYVFEDEVQEASWFKKGFVNTIVTLDKDIKIQKVILKDVGSWK